MFTGTDNSLTKYTFPASQMGNFTIRGNILSHIGQKIKLVIYFQTAHSKVGLLLYEPNSKFQGFNFHINHFTTVWRPQGLEFSKYSQKISFAHYTMFILENFNFFFNIKWMWSVDFTWHKKCENLLRTDHSTKHLGNFIIICLIKQSNFHYNSSNKGATSMK